jgi:putative transposase
MPCFLGHDDWRLYWKLLAEAAGREDCRVHAYALMSNHVHILATSDSPTGLCRMMKRTAEIYAMSFNRAHGRTGHLWEGRFRSSIVQSDDYLFACHRYIEMNPVRAGLVSHPGDYLWSSYRANAEGEPDLVVPHDRYLALASAGPERRLAYRSLFAPAKDEREIAIIRAAVQGGFVLGSAQFAGELERITGRPAARRPRGRQRGRSLAVTV